MRGANVQNAVLPTRAWRGYGGEMLAYQINRGWRGAPGYSCPVGRDHLSQLERVDRREHEGRLKALVLPSEETAKSGIHATPDPQG
eukprot:1144344-Prorocentrum_minimum.AAC.1